MVIFKTNQTPLLLKIDRSKIKVEESILRMWVKNCKQLVILIMTYCPIFTIQY